MPSATFSERYGAVVTTLVEARREAGLTQVELAAILGRPQSYVSKVERRERRVDPVEFYDWGVALKLEPHALFRRLVDRLC
jgi:transcriptional regulator with XRE-family HTH domain